MERAMADDQSRRAGPQPGNINEGHEVRYWTQKWDVTKERMMAAVKKAGVSVAAVAKALGQK
jgi:hypothetical protein